ncbi:MAG: hypothetical protein ACT4PT_11640 [Methanobacteriota archaeon]
MKRWILGASLIAALGAAVWFADADRSDPAPVVEASTPPPPDAGLAAGIVPHDVSWDGYVRVGAADMLAHTYETEPVAEPFAKMGFNVEVPPATTSLAFRLVWPAGTPMHYMVHGPPEAGMPTYMSEMPDSGDDCFAVPAEGVVPGVWKVMAHSRWTTVDLAFTLHVLTEGLEAPPVLEGYHGHKMADGMSMEMKETVPCAAP